MKMFRMMAAALSAACAMAQGAEEVATSAAADAAASGGEAGASAAATGAERLSPPDQLVLRAYQWVKVPELPELRGRGGCECDTLVFCRTAKRRRLARRMFIWWLNTGEVMRRGRSACDAAM